MYKNSRNICRGVVALGFIQWVTGRVFTLSETVLGLGTGVTTFIVVCVFIPAILMVLVAFDND